MSGFESTKSDELSNDSGAWLSQPTGAAQSKHMGELELMNPTLEVTLGMPPIFFQSAFDESSY